MEINTTHFFSEKGMPLAYWNNEGPDQPVVCINARYKSSISISVNLHRQFSASLPSRHTTLKQRRFNVD